MSAMRWFVAVGLAVLATTASAAGPAATGTTSCRQPWYGLAKEDLADTRPAVIGVFMPTESTGGHDTSQCQQTQAQEECDDWSRKEPRFTIGTTCHPWNVPNDTCFAEVSLEGVGEASARCGETADQETRTRTTSATLLLELSRGRAGRGGPCGENASQEDLAETQPSVCGFLPTKSTGRDTSQCQQALVQMGCVDWSSKELRFAVVGNDSALLVGCPVDSGKQEVGASASRNEPSSEMGGNAAAGSWHDELSHHAALMKQIGLTMPSSSDSAMMPESLRPTSRGVLEAIRSVVVTGFFLAAAAAMSAAAWSVTGSFFSMTTTGRAQDHRRSKMRSSTRGMLGAAASGMPAAAFIYALLISFLLPVTLGSEASCDALCGSSGVRGCPHSLS